MEKTNNGFQSACVREFKEKATTAPHILPIYATSSFELNDIDQSIRIFSKKESGYVYSRYANPTIDAVADKIAQLEAFCSSREAYGILFSSGMSAISTLVSTLLKSGDKLVTQANIYGGTTELFDKVFANKGIETIYTDLYDESTLVPILKDSNVKLIYFETPANPTLACLDIKKMSELAQTHGVYSVIDNTFCTPYLQRPLQWGIDFVLHSNTKYLNGHGNATSGVVVSHHEEKIKDQLWTSMKLMGTNSNPFDAWLTWMGLKTLPLRMDKHCQNAMKVAQFLDQHPQVLKVNYPGLESHSSHHLAQTQMSDFGGMLSFELKGGMDNGLAFMRKIKFCKLAPTLGDVDTLILHPATSSHINIPREIRISQGITDGLIRLSIGIEDVEDIITDLEQAFAF